MLGIVRYGDTPGELRAADGKIAQAAAHEREHFVAARLRADEIGLLGVEANQLVLERREFEVIVFFVDGFRGAAAIGAGSAGLRIDVEFIGNAVLAGVSSLVDIAVIANLAPQRLHALLVARGGGADEIVVGQAHALPERTEFGGNFVGELLRGFARGLGCALDFLTVFIGAGQEPSVIPQHAVAARDRVADDGGVGVSNVRTRIDVVDRGRDVELLGHSNSVCFAGISLYHRVHRGTQGKPFFVCDLLCPLRLKVFARLEDSAGSLPASRCGGARVVLPPESGSLRIRAHSSRPCHSYWRS